MITDGQMDSDDIKLGPVITDTVNRLRDAGWNSKQIGINFVQVGNDDNVAKVCDGLILFILAFLTCCSVLNISMTISLLHSLARTAVKSAMI